MSSVDPYFIGVDVGTQSVRGGLVSSEGIVLKIASLPIETKNPSPGYYEQSSDEIWSLCISVIKEITQGIDKTLVKGIGFDATCSLVVIDEDFKPVTVSKTGNSRQNIVLWMDHRAVEEANFISNLAHPVLNFVGKKMSPEMEPPKLLWLKKNLPNTWNKAEHFFDLPDFLTFKATGCLERSLCSLVCKWTYQAGICKDEGWQDDFWHEIGLQDLVATNYRKIGKNVIMPGNSCGNGLSATAADEMGLLPGIPVSASIIDAHAGGVGVLACTPSNCSTNIDSSLDKRLALICGTSTCHMKVSDKCIFTPGIWGPYFSVMVPDLWCSEAGQSATGALLDHIIKSHPATASLKGQIMNSEKYRHITDYLNEYAVTMSKNENLSSVSWLTSDCHTWPDYHGNRSPLANPDLKGMICGLTLTSSIEDLVKLYVATVQSLAYSTKHIIQELEKSGHSVKTLLVCGGLSKNPLYIQMHADITGLPTVIPDTAEPVLVGAAILGASAAKYYSSVTEAMTNMCGSGKLVKPNSKDRDYHLKKYEVFMKLLNCQEDALKIMKSVKI